MSKVPAVDTWPSSDPTRIDRVSDMLEQLLARITRMDERPGVGPHMWVTTTDRQGVSRTVCAICSEVW